MSPALESTCREIMARGGFPYAHLDFLLAEDGQTHLSEINLRGGIRGAAISPDQYRRRIEELHRKFAEDQGFSMEPARLA